MAQSLLTQRGVEFGSTMRSLQATAKKQHAAKKWRHASSPSSSSDSGSSSESDSSRSSAEREFSIVKEGSFANGPLKLKIAARKVKKHGLAQTQDVGEFDPEEDVGSPMSVENVNVRPAQVVSRMAECAGKTSGRKQKCKRKIEKKRCLQTKDPRGACGGPYSNCKQPRSSRRCSTSGTSTSSSSSSTSSGSSGSSSSGSTSGSSTGCSSGSSSRSSSSGSSSSSSGSSSSSSSSGSSSGSESESCCKYGRCRRRKSKMRRKTKCKSTCTLRSKNCSETSRDSFSDCRTSDKATGGKRLSSEGSCNKKLQVNEIDCFSISSSDENSMAHKSGLQECFSMWRKVEEEHCAIVEDGGFKNESTLQVLSVTNAEVECNINQVELNEEKHLLVSTDSCKNQNNRVECSFDFVCMEQIPVMNKHIASGTSIDLDALPSSLSNVSPDSGIQSSGDSPLRIECELPPQRISSNQTDSLDDFYNNRTAATETSSKLHVPQVKHNSPGLSPPVLTPPDPLWNTGSTLPPPCVEKRKCTDDHPAPLLMQVNVEVKYHQHPNPMEPKVQSMLSEYKRMEFPPPTKPIVESTSLGINPKIVGSLPLCTNISEISNCSKVSDSFSQSSLNLIFNDPSIRSEKSETSMFHDQASAQVLPSSETRRKRNRSQRRNVDISSKADNELQLLVQSVQDSISSQFQGVESDELSDVDVNSIPVTALTCDTTSDSFCDKLSAEDNIELLLNDRTCIHNDQKPMAKSIDATKNEIICIDPCIPLEDTTLLPTTLIAKSPKSSSDDVLEAVAQETQQPSPDIYNSDSRQCEVEEVIQPLADIVSKPMKTLDPESCNDFTYDASEQSVSLSLNTLTIAGQEQQTISKISEIVPEPNDHDLYPTQNSPLPVSKLIDDVNMETVPKGVNNETKAADVELQKNGRKKGAKRGRRKSKYNNLRTISKNTDLDSADSSIKKDDGLLCNGSIDNPLPVKTVLKSLPDSNLCPSATTSDYVSKVTRQTCNSDKGIKRSEAVRNFDFIKGTMSENIEDYEALLEIPVIVTDDNEPENVNVSDDLKKSTENNVPSDVPDSKLTVPLETPAKSVRMKSSKRKGFGKASKQSPPVAKIADEIPEIVLDSKESKEIDANFDSNQNNFETKNKVKDKDNTVLIIDNIDVEKGLSSINIEDKKDLVDEKINTNSSLGNKVADKPLKDIVEIDILSEKVNVDIPSSHKKRGRKSKNKTPMRLNLDKPIAANDKLLPEVTKRNEKIKDISSKSDALLINTVCKKQVNSEESSILSDVSLAKVPDLKIDACGKNEASVSMDLPATRSRQGRYIVKKSVQQSKVFDNYNAVIEEVANLGTSDCKENTQAEPCKTSNDEHQTSSSNLVETASPDLSSNSSSTSRRKSKKCSPKVLGDVKVPITSDSITNKSSTSNDQKISVTCQEPVISTKQSKVKKNNKQSFKNTDVSELKIDPTHSALHEGSKVDNVGTSQKRRKSLLKSKALECEAASEVKPSTEEDSKMLQSNLTSAEEKKPGRRKSTASNKKELPDSVSNKSSDKNIESPPKKSDTLELKPSPVNDRKHEPRKKSGKTDPDPQFNKCLPNGAYSAELPPRRNMRQKSINKKSNDEISPKSKKVTVIKDELIHNKVKNIHSKDKPQKNGLAIEKLLCVESKDSDFLDNNHFAAKPGKKEVIKPKVEEEKENLGVSNTDKLSPGKQKAKLGKEGKAQSVKVLSEETKKGWPCPVDPCEVDYPERESEKDDVLSSLSVNEEAMDAYSDACGSSGIDRHSSLEIHAKRKKQYKRKLVNDPNFLTDLDRLTKQLKSCYISKNHVKLKGTTLNDLIPSVFQFGVFIKGRTQKLARLMHLLQNSTVPKQKASVAQEKAKKVLKTKSAPKIMPNQKPKPSVSENCLPLKKRRCLVPPTQVQTSKTVVNEPPAPKQSLAKRIASSFDESIEECIRKHMMRDLPVEKSTPTASTKSKVKPNKPELQNKSFESYNETIDSCVKNFVASPKEDLSEDAEDVPLASLVNQKNKRKCTDAVQAYRQKRKRLLKEACEKAQKKETGSPPEVTNGQRKKRRWYNKTGFVRVRKKKAKPVSIPEPAVPVAPEATADQEPSQTASVRSRKKKSKPVCIPQQEAPVVAETAGDVIDLTAEETYLDAIESVVRAGSGVKPEEARSRRKRKNVAQKCEIEILDIASGNDDNDGVECVGSKKMKITEEEEVEPKYRQVIQVTEPSSGRRSIPSDPRKARRREVHFPKKKFLRAGLYSSCFKEDPPSTKKASSSSSSKKSRSREIKEYVPEDHEFGLMPPPIHVGRYLREKRCEYKLPFDLWWLYKHKQLVYNDEMSNNYKKIRTNVYVDIKPDSTKNEDDQPCMCVPPKDNRRRGCGLECLNRMMYVECTPQLCPCREQCSNQRIFKHEWSPGLERFMTRNRGWGIRTTEFIRSGEFILEYVGEVVSDTEFRHRMAERYRNDQHHYCLSLDSGTVIDGYRLAGEGRFVNHSCEPNCEMQKWYVNGHYRVGLFSMRDIFPNTELCYDYNFINYNLETQQICRCGSPKCRGFIGGRSQRLNGQAKEKVRQVKQSKAIADSKKGPGRPKKRKDERPVEIQKEHLKNEYLPYHRQSVLTIQMKPMSHQQRCYVQKHHCFLLRNYERVKKAKDHARMQAEREAERENQLNKQDAFHAQFTALNTARSVKTRRLANAEENTELAKTAKLAQVFKDIFTAVTSYKGEDGSTLASPFFQLPSKRKNPEYFTKIKLPIDFATIEKNIITGQYKSVDAFEDDFLRLFENAEEYHGKSSELGQKVGLLRKVYDGAKTEAMILFEDILGDSMSSVFASSKTDENKTEEDDEVIRCICNIYKDEGLMIQCDKCYVWQHCDCIGVDGKVEKYLCEQCSGIELSKEILMVPRPHYASPDCQYYLTMLLGGLQIKQGDCVYLRRDHENSSHSPNEKVQEQIAALGVESNDAATRESLRSKKTEDLDIFRIERLWKDEQNNKFVFGHHYLRPHETYHEPSRKFFSNEVFRVPLYEIIPLNCVVGICCVLDLSTYCKGRPKGFKEEDLYICEYRVDKTAHLFYKISKIKYPVCTKKYAFEHFEKRRNPKRTFLPHTVPSAYNKKKGDKGSLPDKKNSKGEANQKEEKKKRGTPKDIDTRLEESQESREQKRAHLNQLLLGMLGRMPCKQTVDLSYLLEGGLGKRIRRKAALS